MGRKDWDDDLWYLYGLELEENDPEYSEEIELHPISIVLGFFVFFLILILLFGKGI